MSRLALLGLLTVAACGLEKGGLGVSPEDSGSQSSTFEDATRPSGGDAGDEPSSELDGTPEAIAPEARDDAEDAPAEDAPAEDASDDGAGLDAADGSFDAGNGKDATAVDAAEEPTADAPSDAPSGSTVDSPAEAEPPPDAPPSCVSGIPAGWTVAIYDLGPDACPATFPQHNVETAPTLGDGACTCACAVAQEGSCTEGTLATSGDTANALACGAAWFTVPIADSTCTTIPVPAGGAIRDIPLSFQAQPLPPVPGTCASTLATDPTQLTTSAARYCDVPPASAESVCGGVVPSGFAACIASPGAKACPAGTAFTHAFPVETAAALKCSACTACTVDTSCDNAVLSVHTGPRCGDTGVDLTVDGTCGPSGFIGVKAAVAVEYTADESSTCAAGASTASAALTGPVTICCL